MAKSAYHLKGVFGKNFSTNVTGRSTPQKMEKELAVPFVNPFTTAENIWVQTNMEANGLLGLLSRSPAGFWSVAVQTEWFKNSGRYKVIP